MRLRGREIHARCADGWTVRARYAAAAVAAADHPAGCGPNAAVITEEQVALFGSGLYADGERDELPDTALMASLGCGNPTAMAELHDGMSVLDLGSGGGIDVLLSARRVAPTGTAYGLDMTDEMLDLARANQAKAGITNVHWLKGHIEAIRSRPTASTSSSPTASSTSPPTNPRCSAKPPAYSSQAAASRSDVIADPHMDDATRADMQQYVGCVAGALTHDQYTRYLTDAGLTEIEITETHRVHEHAGSAIICAGKPS